MRVDGRWLGVALAASLLANLFLAGLATGRWLAPASPAAVGGGGVASQAGLRLLPAEERARFARVMLPHRPQLRAARQAVRAARARVEADIAAPAYDRARTEADFAALRQATLAQQAAAHAAVAEALGEVSPASRLALVEHARRLRTAHGDGVPAAGVGNAAPTR